MHVANRCFLPAVCLEVKCYSSPDYQVSQTGMHSSTGKTYVSLHEMNKVM